MPDQKISALTELTAPDAVDELPVVDKSDTSSAASGTTKRIAYASLLAAHAARLAALETGTATIEETGWHTVTITDLANAGTRLEFLPVRVALAHGPAKVVAARMMTSTSGGVPASDTNFYDLRIRRYRANVFAEVAAKTTKVTGGEAMGAYTDWNLNGATFHATNQILQAGDAVVFTFLVTGAPALLFWPTLSVRIEPV